MPLNVNIILVSIIYPMTYTMLYLNFIMQDRLVHGPLSGTLLMTLLRTHVSEKHGHLDETRILSFDYRCLMPLYVDKPLTLCGRQVSDTDDNHMLFDLWIVDHDNNLAVKGNAVISNKV